MRPLALTLVLTLVLVVGCEGAVADPDGGARTDGAPRDAPLPDAVLADDAASPGRGGPVRLVGRELHDDGGPFVALGASLFWAAWGYRNARARLEANLAWLRDHGFDYVRALGLVGDPDAADYWDGREAELRWADYDEVIAGLTDLAWDTYGLRVEWTLIGDGQVSIPDPSDREALVDRFVAMAVGREDAIMHFEIANEAWQNGFEGDPGNAQLQALARRMRDATDRIVAASAPFSSDCAGIVEVYGGTGSVADLATIHFDRDLGLAEGHWGPVWRPFALASCGDWVGSNNEPIGPGSSVAMEDDPTILAASALTTWISGLPFHVFHSRAGVRGDEDVWTMPGADAFGAVHALVPGDLPGWDRRAGNEADAPLRAFAEDEGGTLVPDVAWMDVAGARSGAVRAHQAIRGDRFVAIPIGLRGSLVVEARSRALSFDVFHPVTGAMLAHHDLASGERATLSGADALVVRGELR